MSTVDEMIELVVKFQSDYGFYPAFKERDEEIQTLEEKLARKLHRAQVGLETAFIQELRRRGVMPSRRSQQEAIIDLILNAPFEQMSEYITERAIEAATIGRQLTINDLALQGVSASFTAFSQFVLNRLKERVYTFSQDTFSRIKGDFAKTLSEAYEEGLGIEEAARRLRADFKNLRDHRLRKIARTEIQGAQNEGINETMIDYDVQYKQWITVKDLRVRGRDPSDRFDHVSLHGEVVAFGEEFSNGAKHPLDRSGPIGDWIQCRCIMRPYIPGRNETILTTPYYPSAA